MTMKPVLAVAVLLGCAVAAVSAQSPSSSFPRGNSQQSWQNPGLKSVLAKCKTPPQPFSIPGAAASDANAAPPPAPTSRPSTAIPGVIAAGQNWKAVWSWEGNNADGPIAGDNGTVLFANNDASNVMKLDPATGLATVIHADTNTGGALSRSKNGALFVASRGLNGGILQLEPQRKMFASSFNGEPIECVGGVLNDLVADARGGVYLAISGSGVFYANPKGVVSKYGEGVAGANGIILSRDEKTLYVTNGGVVVAFDVQADGALTNQREFGKLRGGQARRRIGRRCRGTAVRGDGIVGGCLRCERRVPRQHSRAAGSARHVLRWPRQEDALRHRLLRYVGNGERAEPGHRDSDDRAGLHRAREVGSPFVR